MTDLYNIPHDDKQDYRLRKFVEYQHEVPSIHYRFVGEWIKKYKIDKDRAVNICWYMLTTYNEITCILLDEFINCEKLSYEYIWDKYKENLDFGSSRKYAKNNDWFVPLMKQWDVITNGKPYEWLKKKEKKDAEETYKTLQKELGKLKYVGRFSADLFIETVSYLRDYFGISIKEPIEIDWKNCSNLTSGIFNIFYEDKKADEYDKTKKLTEQDKEYLSIKLLEIKEKIKEIYPEQDNEITMFIGKICSFRNLFKSSRYGGFHHDRELGVIKKYEKTMPEYKYLWDECYELRSQIFPDRLLGEKHGWDGIRKERKKLWIKTGHTGVE